MQQIPRSKNQHTTKSPCRLTILFVSFLCCIYVRNLYRATCLTQANQLQGGPIASALREHQNFDTTIDSRLLQRLTGSSISKLDEELLGLLHEAASLRSERSRLYEQVETVKFNLKSAYRQRPRTLMGIFVELSRKGMLYRRKFRRLFPWHPNFCSIAEYQNANIDTADCELIYTFVIGAWNDTSLPGQKMEAPFLVSPDNRQKICDENYLQVDCLEPDMTILDINENLNEGKSQTWIAYASSMAKKLDIDYIGKQDTDSLTKLDRLLTFTREHLPPAPYNKNIMAGFLANKFWWDAEKYGMRMIQWMSGEEELPLEEWELIRTKEGPFVYKYGMPLRPYIQGQFYIFSRDLGEVVAQEALKTPNYTHWHEDHDISAMAMIGAHEPIKIIAVSKQQRFWQHKVKSVLGRPYHERWRLEIERIQNLVLEQFGGDVFERMKRRAFIDG